MANESDFCDVIRTASHGRAGWNKGIIRESSISVYLSLKYNRFSLVFFRMLTNIQIPKSKIVIFYYKFYCGDIKR